MIFPMKKMIRSALLFLCAASVALANPAAFNNAAVTATAVLVKGSPVIQLISINASNPNTSAVYVQVFDAATAGAVTLGTTAPTFWYAIPAGGVLDKDPVAPYVFASGIVVAVTTTPTGNTAPSSAVPISLLYQ